MPDLTTSVLVVGAGGAGLTASALLANLGVDALTIERRSSTSSLCKAHYINQRTMEIFRQHGLAERVYAVGCPPELMSKVRFATSLGGDSPLDGRTICTIDAYGGGETRERYARDSPCPTTDLAQMHLEPLIREFTDERAPGRLLFDHELVSFEQHDDGIVARVRDRANDRQLTVGCEFLIGADGGRGVGAAVGIEQRGRHDMLDMITVHFRADLSAWVPDDGSLQTWFHNATADGLWSNGVIGPRGPHHWGPKSEEWGTHFAMPVSEGEKFDTLTVVPRVRAMLGLPDLDVEVLSVNHWILAAVRAERFRAGRVFLVGDAAHRHPPTTGLGLNSGIQDVHNLCWKLAEVVAGRAGDQLLDSYEAERLPVIDDNIAWSNMTFEAHGLIDKALGIVDGDAQRNAAVLEEFFEDSRTGAARRALVADATGVLKREFQAHDLEIGFRYETGALVPDGTPAPQRDPRGLDYQPSTRPGDRLPHAWLERDRARVSTQDLVKSDGTWLLLVGGSGRAVWESAVKTLLGAPAVRVAVVGSGGYDDVDGAWKSLRGVEDDGALLVRPDHHVAWRTRTMTDNPAGALQQAFATVLRGGPA